ncbi:MAG: threonine/serine dehydratase [Dehalococcoidia bacterium]|nr:threonine/serine dehydratase [Dehalococcoidia bacterium]
MNIPTLRDVYRARATINPYFPRTPLTFSAGLSAVLDAQVYLKHEEHLELGAFKPRGGINLLANMSSEERSRGVITASSGNHGQSIASACRTFGARALIGLPVDANPNKVAAMEALGAELIFHGANFDEARRYCEQLAAAEGYRYVHPVNEPDLIAGVATASLEIIEDLPDVDVMMLPIGGGSGVSGACIVVQALNPSIKVVAVQSEAAPAAYLSWQQGQLVQAPMQTWVEGTATAEGYELPQQIMRHRLHDFILVSDDDIRRAVAMLVEKAHTLAEGAGATALAGAVRSPELVRGKKVSITISGANITLAQLRDCINLYLDS